MHIGDHSFAVKAKWEKGNSLLVFPPLLILPLSPSSQSLPDQLHQPSINRPRWVAHEYWPFLKRFKHTQDKARVGFPFIFWSTWHPYWNCAPSHWRRLVVPFQNPWNHRPYYQSRLHLQRRCQAFRFVSKKSVALVVILLLSLWNRKQSIVVIARWLITILKSRKIHNRRSPRHKIATSGDSAWCSKTSTWSCFWRFSKGIKAARRFPEEKISQGGPKKPIFMFPALIANLFMTKGKSVVHFLFQPSFQYR